MDPGQYAVMRRAEDRHWWYLGMREAIRAILAAHSIDAAKCRWLDAGCGTGGNLAAFGGPAAVGLDASPLALGQCIQRGTKALVQGGVEALPFASGHFDLVTSFEVLYHHDVASDLAAMREFRRVLRPDGFLVLRVPAYNWLRGGHDVVVHTARRYTAPRVTRLIQRAGFKPVHTSYLNSVLLLPAVASRLGLRAAGAARSDDLAQPPVEVNKLFASIIAHEGRWIALGHHLPCGLSVVAIARRPAL